MATVPSNSAASQIVNPPDRQRPHHRRHAAAQVEKRRQALPAAFGKRRQRGVAGEWAAERPVQEIEQGHDVHQERRVHEIRRTQIAGEKLHGGTGQGGLVRTGVAERKAEAESPQPDTQRDDEHSQEKDGSDAKSIAVRPEDVIIRGFRGFRGFRADCRFGRPAPAAKRPVWVRTRSAWTRARGACGSCPRPPRPHPRGYAAPPDVSCRRAWTQAGIQFLLVEILVL